ncbi:transposase [Candidatus Dependentiae bacterium]|nr:transposase [Candidatus Dependentiae bacterium]MBA3752540.1 transposase [Candidatus Dependentiae bacterium]
MLHSIIDNSKKFYTNFILNFACGVILTPQRKTVPSIAKVLNVTDSSIYRTLKKQMPYVSFSPHHFFDYIKPFSQDGFFVIDDSVVTKQFSKSIAGTSEVFDTITNRSCLGLSLITVAWTNGSETIPLVYALWYNKDVAKDEYKTKIALAQELILSIPSSIAAHGLIFDGLYATKEMMEFLVQKNIRFVARAATNRVVQSSGCKLSLKEHPALKLRRNEHSRTIKAEWHGLMLYYTVEKRKDKKGETSIVFLVSNFPDSSKEYVRIYKLRWGIEMFHRTAKQSLGLKDCQSINLDMQKVRICNLFYIYAFLQYQKKLRKASSVESVMRSLQMLKSEELMIALVAFNQIFHENN